MNSQAAPVPATPAFSRTLLPRGLITLILLRYKSVLRRLVFGTAKRRLFTFLGLGLMAVYILPNLFLNRKALLTPEVMKTWLPVFVVFLTASQLFVRARRDPMVFGPAEIDLVVPGPFSRRQLVLYQVLYQIGPTVALGFWMGLFMRSGGGYLSSAIGIMLLFFAIKLVAGIINTTIGILQNISRYIVPVILVGLGGAVYLAVRSAPPFPSTPDFPKFVEWASLVRHTPIMEALCFPVTPYSQTLAGTSVLESLPWAGLALLINIGLIVVFVAVDRGEVETLVIHSQKQLAKIQVARRSGISNPEAAARRQIPMLPRFGGIGPIIWRQLSILYRSSGPIVVAGILLVLIVGCASVAHFADKATIMGIMVIAGTAGCFGMSQVVKCDFRSDLDHMALLKTLPISSIRISTGQLIAPALVIAAVQCIISLGLAIGAASIKHALFGLLIAVAAIPFSAMLIAIDNTVFLLAPIRPIQSSMQGGLDPAQIARIMLITLAKFVVIFVAIAIIGLPTWGLYVVGGAFAAVPVALLLTCAMLTALIFACAKAFDAFNVSDDQPA